MYNDAGYKVILVGDSTIGKTSFFRKLSYDEFHENNIQTIGVDVKTLEYEINIEENGQEVTKDIRLILYDTAGQERFRSCTKSYFKRASGVILLYSIIDRNSFNNLNKWLNDVKEKIENHENNKYLIFLMGTKYDIVKEDETKREVTVNEALDFCDKNNILWYGEYSSKETPQEIFQKLFAEFGRKLYEKIGFNRIERDNISILSSKKNKKRKKRCNNCK